MKKNEMDTLLLILRTYTVPILAAACFPLVGVLLWMVRDVLQIRLKQVVLLAVTFVAFGLTSIIVFGMIHDLKLFPNSTFQHQGLMLFMPFWFLGVAKLMKRDWRDVFDTFAVVMPFVVAGVRIYCILQGCCYGITFRKPVHFTVPVRELTILLNVIVGVLMLRQSRQQHIRGILFPTYTMAYSVIRFSEVALWGSIARDQFFVDRGLAIFNFILGFGLFLELKDRDGQTAKASGHGTKRTKRK